VRFFNQHNDAQESEKKNKMGIFDIYNDFWKKTFPASQNEIEWRTDEIRRRLDNIEQKLGGVIRCKNGNSQVAQNLILELLRLIEPQKVQGFPKIRCGSDHDGGYILLDDFSRVGLALSFGINDDDNWDVSFADRGIPVMQYDNSIDAGPTAHPLISFYKKTISDRISSSSTTLSEIISRYDMSGTEKRNILLKIDIEGDEWRVLDATPECDLQKMSQIVCEFHGMSLLLDADFYKRALRVFKKLHSHFGVYHVHGNNHGEIVSIANIAIPDVIEISFANRSLYKLIETKELFPTPLDSPCNRSLADIRLGSFKF
jgi:hypothetical protein